MDDNSEALPETYFNPADGGMTPPRRVDIFAGKYDSSELGKTSMRPNAYDYLSKPSMYCGRPVTAKKDS